MDRFEKTDSSTGVVTETSNNNKMLPPKAITIRNNESGVEFSSLEGVEFFADTEISFE